MSEDGGGDAEGDGDVEAIELPIDGVLDLHAFSPPEIGEVVTEYLAACAEKGIREVRIIHGKGKGVQRRQVQAVLARNQLVAHQAPADETAGGWGATLVTLRLPEEPTK